MTTADKVEQLQTVIDQGRGTISRLANQLVVTKANWERQIAEISAALGGADSGADGALAATARRVVRERDEEHRARRHYWDEVRALGEVLRRIREVAGYRTGVDAHALAAVGRVVRERDEARKELDILQEGVRAIDEALPPEVDGDESVYALAVRWITEARAAIERTRPTIRAIDGLEGEDR